MPSLKSTIGLFGLSMVHFTSAAPAPQDAKGWPSVINPKILNFTIADTGKPWGWPADKWTSSNKQPAGLPWWQWHPPAKAQDYGPDWPTDWNRWPKEPPKPSPPVISTVKLGSGAEPPKPSPPVISSVKLGSGAVQTQSEEQERNRLQKEKEDKERQQKEQLEQQREQQERERQQKEQQRKDDKQPKDDQQHEPTKTGNKSPGKGQTKHRKRSTVHCESQNRDRYQEDIRSRIAWCRDGLRMTAESNPTMLIGNHIPGVAICHGPRPGEPLGSPSVPIVMIDGTEAAMATFGDMYRGVQDILDQCQGEPLAANVVLYDNEDDSTDPPGRWRFELHVGAF